MSGYAQLNQTIDFDTYNSGTDNDLDKNFTVTVNSNVAQITSYGINGGSLSVLTASAATKQPVVFNKPLKLSTTKTTASICFKYNRSYFVAGSGEHGVELSFINSDGSPSGLSFSAQGDEIKTLAPGSSFSASYPLGARLLDGHWYQFKASIAISPTQSSHIMASIYLYDLSTSGQGTPTSVTFRVDDDIATTGLTSNTVKLALNAAGEGGANYLDNFSISGEEALSVLNDELALALRMPTVISSTIHLSSSLGKMVRYRLYDLKGACVAGGDLNKEIAIDCSMLPAAHYLIRLSTENASFSRVLVKL